MPALHQSAPSDLIQSYNLQVFQKSFSLPSYIIAAMIFAWSFTDHIILVLRSFFKIFLQGKKSEEIILNSSNLFLVRTRSTCRVNRMACRLKSYRGSSAVRHTHNFLKSCFSISNLLCNISTENQQ